MSIVTTKRTSNISIKPILSKCDEGVPADHIGLYEMFVISPQVRRLYGENKAQEMRKKSYENVEKLFYEYGSGDYAKFWNLHIKQINYRGDNEFAKFAELKDVCEYIKAFTRTIKVQGKSRREISFGISLKLLKDYKEKKEKALAEGKKFVPPLRVNNKGWDRDSITFGEQQFNMGKKIQVKVAKNCLYNRFEHWRKIRNLTRPKALLLALDAVVKYYPEKGIKPLEEYHVKTVYDDVYCDSEEQGLEEKPIRMSVAGSVYEQMVDIIFRYNFDPNNKTNKLLTISNYVPQAIKLMNEKMPLKYSDPDAFKEYMLLQKGEVKDEQ